MQRSERGFWGFIQHLEQGFGSTGWAALALFPVADGVQGHVNPLGKLRLAQTQALAARVKIVVASVMRPTVEYFAQPNASL